MVTMVTKMVGLKQTENYLQLRFNYVDDCVPVRFALPIYKLSQLPIYM